mmetsp:Transcript_113436/g.284114  ORF Transcript_113436/g.284114 Transcript_113436/m.284114 type:complete len:213 (-) Transcript_113436:196-834(-)
MPSHVKTKPANGCSTAMIIIKGRAVICTSAESVNIAGMLSAPTVSKAPVRHPPAPPQNIRRFATSRALALPPPAIAVGMRPCAATAIESKANKAKNQVRIPTWCAATAKPPTSSPTTVRVNCRRTVWRDNVRSSCELPPTINGCIAESADGQVRAACHATLPCLVKIAQKAPHASQIDKEVANAAPCTPSAGMPTTSNPKTSMASSITLATV